MDTIGAVGTMESVRAERTFPTTPEHVSEVRRWTSGLLDDGCELRDDATLLVSELAGNAACHGIGGSIRVVVTHHFDGVTAEVHERGLPVGHVMADADVLAEMRALADLTDGAAVDIDALADAGRGLPLLEHLTGGRWHIGETTAGRVVSFMLTGCRCRLRVLRRLHPDWGIVHDTGLGVVRAVRAGYADVTANDLLELHTRLLAIIGHQGRKSDGIGSSRYR